jgi:hypothetical protein
MPKGGEGMAPGSSSGNRFGRASKEGAAPEGANPFAAPPPSYQDEMAQMIAAKKQVEAGGYTRPLSNSA